MVDINEIEPVMGWRYWTLLSGNDWKFLEQFSNNQLLRELLVWM